MIDHKSVTNQCEVLISRNMEGSIAFHFIIPEKNTIEVATSNKIEITQSIKQNKIFD